MRAEAPILGKVEVSGRSFPVDIPVPIVPSTANNFKTYNQTLASEMFRALGTGNHPLNVNGCEAARTTAHRALDLGRSLHRKALVLERGVLKGGFRPLSGRFLSDK